MTADHCGEACIVDACDKPRKTKAGHCGMHNERLRIHGDVHYVKFIVGDPERRFWSQVDKGADCWLWLGHRDRDGYGRFKVNGSPRMAHRWSWLLSGRGEVPAGMYLDHLCKVRHCVNPTHLEVVTTTENNRRSDCPTGLNYRKTECPKCGGAYSVDRRGKRFCSPCKAAWRRQKRAANRAQKDAA